MTQKTIETNTGTTIAYEERGHGHPVILLHGFVGDRHYWDHIIESLSQYYRVIAIDLPGHGDSSLSPSTTTTEDYADEIASFVQRMQLDKITLVGHSFGGYITVAFAQKFAFLLDRFALVHSTALPDTEEAKKGRNAGMQKIQAEGLNRFVDDLIPKLFAPAFLADFEQVAKDIGYGTSVVGTLAALQAMRDRPDLSSVLESINLPILIIAGEEDKVVPPKRAFATTRAGIEQQTIATVGHMSMYEAPKKLVNELVQFIGDKK